MNASQDLQTSGNNSFSARAAFVNAGRPNDLRGIGLFSNGPVFQVTHPVPRQEGAMQSALSETRELFRERQESFVNEMDWLKTMYVFPGGNSVELFLSSHRAVGAVLEDALPHLKESFGPDIVFKLETSTEEDEPPILYVIAVWRGSVEGAVAAVESLDEKWWLDNSSRSPDMAFTYELD